MEMTVLLASGDVDNCFHRMCLQGWLRHYFCWPPLPAATLGISKLLDVPLSSEDLVYPLPQFLPMGFSWPPFLAQTANQYQMECSILEGSSYLTDRGDAWVVNSEKSRLAHYVYIDNLGILGIDPEEVRRNLDSTTL